MQVYQEAFLALQKIRTGGKQTVVVQHVQVSQGGQAVIAGSLKSNDEKTYWRGVLAVLDHCEYMKDIWRNELSYTRRRYNKPDPVCN
jgi:hypothetical protein